MFGNHNHQADPDFSNQDVLTNMLETFIETWKIALSQSKKLVLYQSLKDNFGAEPYLHYVRHQHRSSLTKLRRSSHPLAIETGRYAPHEGTFARRCRLCAPDVEDIRHLPFFDPIVEDEFHMLLASGVPTLPRPSPETTRRGPITPFTARPQEHIPLQPEDQKPSNLHHRSS